MMTLEDIRATPEEDEMTGDMPEQVAIGFIIARRRRQQQHRQEQFTKHFRGKDETLADRLFKNNPKGYPHG